MSAPIPRILGAWGGLNWRHHGTGMLQAYLPGSTTERVHVWHWKLIRPGMRDSGAMHNHRYALESTVLAGSIVHTDLEVDQDGAGDHWLWRIAAASKSRDVDLVKVHRCNVHRHNTRMVHAGETYRVEKWAFHHAEPSALTAVTYVRLEDKDEDGAALLLAPDGTTPVAAFQDDTEYWLPIIRETLAAGRYELERVR